MAQDKSIGVIPVRRDDNDFLFLLVHQVVGHWAFPKGHPNPGETELETALRELNEETSISKCQIVEDFRYTQTYSFVENGETTNKEVIFFIGFVSNDEIKIMEDEVQAFAWLPFDECMERLTYDESRTMLRTAYQHIKETAAGAAGGS